MLGIMGTVRRLKGLLWDDGRGDRVLAKSPESQSWFQLACRGEPQSSKEGADRTVCAAPWNLAEKKAKGQR